MNVKLTPARVISSLESQNTLLDTLRDDFQSTRTAVNAYRNESQLTGLAFQDHKDYFGEGHIPFIVAYRGLLTAHRTANETHIYHLRALTHENYDRQQMEAELNQLAWSIPAAQSMVVLLVPENERCTINGEILSESSFTRINKLIKKSTTD